jgi:aspartyl/asparaginyl beta-hydroxylase (cupin superfamily)
VTSTARELLEQADLAVASGDISGATALLEQAAASSGDDISIWMKLAAVQRAAGDVPAALMSVQRALAISPLDFMALLMRASLLDRTADPDANVAWSHALAQRPNGDLPPPIAAAVAQAEHRVAEWNAAREAAALAAMAKVEAAADDEQRQRMARFRSNALRRTRHYHSEPTEFHYPGLVEREFHPRRLFPWLEQLEAATDMLTAELRTVMSAERAELVPYIQYDDHLPLEQWRALNRNPDWTAIHLLQNGEIVESNARCCPGTMELLSRIPQPQIPGASPNAMFSLLAPQTAIPPHVGVNNARLVCHLPLIVPEGCWFRVGAETCYWQRGGAFVFDDTIEHEALNPSAELRVVFILDVWHPDLSGPEREAVAAMVGVMHGAAGAGL